MQDTGEECNYRFKLVMLGDPNTGKTSLVQRYVYNSYDAAGTQSTIGVDVLKKVIMVDNEVVKLNIWDTGGQDKYSSITDMYFRKTLGFILVYDITEESSFDTLDYWMNKIKDKAIENAVVFLAGNKVDDKENRKVNKEEVEKYVQKNLINRHYLVSAKEGDHVANLFQDLAQEVIEKINKGLLPQDQQTNQGQQLVTDNNPNHVKDKVKKPECC